MSHPNIFGWDQKGVTLCWSMLDSYTNGLIGIHLEVPFWWGTVKKILEVW